MIDNEIEKALATDKVDWKEPLWAKFRNYVIGFGVAVVFVALVLTAAYFWLKPEPLAQQTEPTMTVYPLPQVTAKATVQKKVTQTIKKPEVKPTINEMETVEKPIKPAEPLTEFDRDLEEFERKIP